MASQGHDAAETPIPPGTSTSQEFPCVLPPSSPLSSCSDSTISDPYDEPEAAVLGSKRPLDEKDEEVEENEAKRQRGYPLVWSDTRHGLCETVPYYREYKRSVHHPGGTVLGVFINKDADARDVFGAEVIIATTGGGRTNRDGNGVAPRIADQKFSADQQSLMKAFEADSAIVVIAGREHPRWPGVVPDHYYNVLGFFHITDMWPERRSTKENGQEFLTWVVRYEKIFLDLSSWWARGLPDGSDLGHSTVDAPKAPVQPCNVCSTESKQIFNGDHWTCLNKECAMFFEFTDKELNRFSLSYNPNFLKERTAFKGKISISIHPPLPNTDFANLLDRYGTETEYRIGICCPWCGCCTGRIKWIQWECSNPQCSFVLDGNMQPVPDHVFLAEVKMFQSKRNHCVRFNSDVIHSLELPVGGRTASVYLLTTDKGDLAGSVVRIPADDKFCQRPNGPNEIFRALETADTGLKRNPVVHPGLPTEGLTRNFGQNYGAFYKYGVNTQSKAFGDAPDAILKAVQLAIWAGNSAIELTQRAMVKAGFDLHKYADTVPVAVADVNFNEMLHLAYMEGDKIKPHDDGEKDLGPTVACLALGSPAMMYFRPKKGKTFTKVKKGNEYAHVLDFPVYHGDLVIMHGTPIHEFYEHGVDPQGIRRFALTGRRIELNNLTSAERAKAVLDGAIPARAAKWEYDGNNDSPDVTDVGEVTPSASPA